MTADVASTVYPPEHARDAEAIEAGRLLFAGTCDFVAGAPTADALPPDTLPEVAFAGRSNVGKSSLLNALTGRTTLARVSNTPGRTRQLNFFSLADRRCSSTCRATAMPRRPNRRSLPGRRSSGSICAAAPGCAVPAC